MYYRGQWTSGFSRLQGDDGDARLIAYLCEHWFRVIHGQDSWRNPSFFYPVKGVLGWSDCFVLYQILYAPLRWIGLDPFESLQVTVILLSLVGYLTFIAFVRRAFNTPRPAAVVLGLIFVFANGLYLHAGFAQLAGVYLLPVLMLLGLASWRAAPKSSIRVSLLAGLLGLTWALLFFTTYYIAWFAALAAAIVVVVAFLSAPRRFVACLAARPGTWKVVAGGAGGLAIGIIPFLMTYLPARGAGIGSSYQVAMTHAGRIGDLLNVGSGNLWSSLVHRIDPGADFGIYEHTYAVTPVVMVLAVGGGVLALLALRRHTTTAPAQCRAAAVLAGATIVTALLPITTGVGSPWAVIYHLPGASAMRAIFRLEIVTGLLATTAIAAAAAYLWAPPAVRAQAANHDPEIGAPGRLRWAALALLVVALAEQVNTTPVSHISDPAQNRLLRSVRPPPPACRSFYVTDSARRDLQFYEYQVDAMLISQKVSLPTINGYTGYKPPGWNLDFPQSTGYHAAVEAWAASHGITDGLCDLDLADGSWHRWPSPAD